jgi:reverse gyrase
VLLKIASRGNLIDLIEKSSGHGISESDVGWIGAIYPDEISKAVKNLLKCCFVTNPGE